MSEDSKGNKALSIFTTISSIVVAVIGLITMLGENGFINRRQEQQAQEATATHVAVVVPTDDVAIEIPTETPVDVDIPVATLVPATATQADAPEPTEVVLVAPTCSDYTQYNGKDKKNATLLGYTQDAFWVGLDAMPAEATEQDTLIGFLFDGSDEAQTCLHSWVKFLSETHTPYWPSDVAENGRTSDEVWLSSTNPPLVGELGNWGQVPDKIVVAVVNDTLTPQYVQTYACGADIPEDTLAHVAFWHTGTSLDSLSEYIDLYTNNGYEFREAVVCE